ncbi:MAG: hypothetical protein ABI763_10220 [Bacteroidota bacterium]
MNCKEGTPLKQTKAELTERGVLGYEPANVHTGRMASFRKNRCTVTTIDFFTKLNHSLDLFCNDEGN